MHRQTAKYLCLFRALLLLTEPVSYFIKVGPQSLSPSYNLLLWLNEGTAVNGGCVLLYPDSSFKTD